jgi:hypothetical protein
MRLVRGQFSYVSLRGTSSPRIAVLRRPTPNEDSARTAVLTAEAFWCSLNTDDAATSYGIAGKDVGSTQIKAEPPNYPPSARPSKGREALAVFGLMTSFH